jgi:hypothetical protein
MFNASYPEFNVTDAPGVRRFSRVRRLSPVVPVRDPRRHAPGVGPHAGATAARRACALPSVAPVVHVVDQQHAAPARRTAANASDTLARRSWAESSTCGWHSARARGLQGRQRGRERLREFRGLVAAARASRAGCSGTGTSTSTGQGCCGHARSSARRAPPAPAAAFQQAPRRTGPGSDCAAQAVERQRRALAGEHRWLSGAPAARAQGPDCHESPAGRRHTGRNLAAGIRHNAAENQVQQAPGQNCQAGRPARDALVADAQGWQCMPPER